MSVITYFSPFRFKSKEQQRVARLEWEAAKLIADQLYLEAIENYTRVLVLDPKNVAAYLHRGKSFLAILSYVDAYSDFKAGRGILERNASMYKSEPDWVREVYSELLLLEELTAIELGVTESVIDKILPVNEGVVPDPSTEKYRTIARLIGQMNIAEKAKDYRAAILAVSDIITLDPRRLSAYMKRGKLHNRIHDYQQAAHDFSAGWYVIESDKGYLSGGTSEKKMYEQFVARHTKAIDRLSPLNPARIKFKIGQYFTKGGNEQP